MKIEVNITKKYAFLIVITLIVIAGVAFVIANHNTGTPNPGHDISEIGGIEECASGFVLTHDSSGGLKCVQDGSIGCDWAGWRGALTFTVKEGSKYPSSYQTTIWNCVGGKLVEAKYMLCSDANQAPYNAGIDCSK